MHFNTSYVTVQPWKSIQFKQMIRISIHLMLRFNFFGCSGWYQIIRISIHLMLRFNCKRINNLFRNTIISIHLMLRFNKALHLHMIPIIKFQYILCYGSTGRGVIISVLKHYFNTSYVTVQLDPSYFSVLFEQNFNTSYVTVQLN